MATIEAKDRKMFMQTLRWSAATRPKTRKSLQRPSECAAAQHWVAGCLSSSAACACSQSRTGRLPLDPDQRPSTAVPRRVVPASPTCHAGMALATVGPAASKKQWPCQPSCRGCGCQRCCAGQRRLLALLRPRRRCTSAHTAARCCITACRRRQPSCARTAPPQRLRSPPWLDDAAPQRRWRDRERVSSSFATAPLAAVAG